MLSASEDGIHFEVATKEEVLQEAKDIQDGECSSKGFFGPNDPIDSDPNYWGSKILLIKGEIVQPKPVKRVTEFEVE